MKFLKIKSLVLRNGKKEEYKILDWMISDENKKKLSSEEAKFLFEQAEKQLKQSIEISAKIVTRSTILLTVLVGIVTSLLGFIFKHWFEVGKLDMPSKSAILIIIYLMSLVVYISINIRGHKYMDIGSEPKTLLHDHFFLKDPDNKDNSRLIYYYVTEIIEYQERIENNKKTNGTRWRQFHIALWGVVLVPVIFILVYALIRLCQPIIFF